MINSFLRMHRLVLTFAKPTIHQRSLGAKNLLLLKLFYAKMLQYFSQLKENILSVKLVFHLIN